LSEGKWIILAKETACRGGVLPDASTGHPVSTANGTGTLASIALRNDFSCDGGKVVTVASKNWDKLIANTSVVSTSTFY